MVRWAHQSPQPKRHVDRSSRFAGLTSVTDRPTDHATRSVTIGRIYVGSTAMRPNNTRDVQKVRRLTQSVTRYVHNILSFLNIVSCNWNALGSAFLQSSDSFAELAEELLILLFQFAICRADNVFPFKIAPSHGGSELLSNTWFIRPTGVNTANGSRSFQLFKRIWMNERQTDQANPSVTIGCIYIVVICGLIISCAIL